VFGDRDKANAWLRRPLAELRRETPLAIAQTEAGARVIETILGKIAWGAAAFDGRWNTAGHAVTYCATSPSLCVLEKLVHVEDPGLLPELIMVAYFAPDELPAETLAPGTLPSDWRREEGWTQRRGNSWHVAQSSALLRVPPVIVPLANSPDVNVLINHTHPDASQVTIRSMLPFVLDPRIF